MAQDLDFFRTKINEYAEDKIQEDMLIPAMPIQLNIKKNEVNLNTARLISKLEPFGAGNQMPLFCFRGAVLSGKKSIGNGKHLKLTLGIDGQTVDGVYFGKGPLDSGIFIGDRVDIVFTLEINNWQNVESVQIKVWDMRLNDALLQRNKFMLKALKQVECLDCDDNWLYNGIIDKVIKYDDIEINREVLAVIYRYISRLEQKRLSLADLFVHARIIENETKKNINCFKLFVALLVFDELELIGLELEKNGTYKLIPPEEVKKVNLEDSEILDWVRQAAQGF